MEELETKKEKVARRTPSQIKIDEVKLAYFNVASAVTALLESKDKSPQIYDYFVGFSIGAIDTLKEKIHSL